MCCINAASLCHLFYLLCFSPIFQTQTEEDVQEEEVTLIQDSQNEVSEHN